MLPQASSSFFQTRASSHRPKAPLGAERSRVTPFSRVTPMLLEGTWKSPHKDSPSMARILHTSDQNRQSFALLAKNRRKLTSSTISQHADSAERNCYDHGSKQVQITVTISHLKQRFFYGDTVVVAVVAVVAVVSPSKLHFASRVAVAVVAVMSPPSAVLKMSASRRPPS